MQGFQQLLQKDAGPVDTHAAIADLITSIKNNKGKKKPVDPHCQEDPIAEFTLRDIHTALDSLSKLPAFAQLTIASRFVKSALPTIRNKEAHMQHLIRVYIQENPHLAVIPHVSDIIPSYKTDSGLFDHGYAPPQPVQGVLENPPFRAYPMEKLMRDQKEKFSLDEFGRVKTHKSSSSSLLPRVPAPTSSSQSTSSHSASSSTSLVSIFRKSDMYHRLSPTIRDALEGVYTAGRIKEVLNDTVLQRLMKLPEHLAMRAVDNFRGTDISHVDNLNGFFVGIITRILDRERATAPPPGRGPAGYGREVPYDDFRAQPNYPPQQYQNAPTTPWAHLPVYEQFIRVLAPSIQNEIIRMVQTGVLQSIDEIAEKCYEILGQLAEPLALEALNRYSTSNLESVRNRSGFLIGVVKRVRQEYGVM
ncbi:hypothetical protein THRCLA_09695 [Thraustotheca clavata]|uniref:Heterogeneous nuclear ribonucleoprotein Q acidic domain-containing protein n=1 Tax=Thraustotheca clavata TaxID=74557 RepID=A0A1V9YUQ4_9STRA|nr:hypothetical protein THRCLA_09695 [Thraustotheca clavata]